MIITVSSWDRVNLKLEKLIQYLKMDFKRFSVTGGRWRIILQTSLICWANFLNESFWERIRITKAKSLNWTAKPVRFWWWTQFRDTFAKICETNDSEWQSSRASHYSELGRDEIYHEETICTFRNIQINYLELKKEFIVSSAVKLRIDALIPEGIILFALKLGEIHPLRSFLRS